MATGDAADFLARLKRVIPTGWINNAVAPIANAIIGGVADSLAAVYSLFVYAIAQTRISSAYSFWLDLIAWDFLGSSLVRTSGQSDASFQALVKQAIVQPRVTRAGVASVITNLTGNAPTIIEPWNTNDCGAWDVASAFAWDYAGRWGETPATLPGQVFIIPYRSGWQGVPNVIGWSVAGFGAWDVGAIEWVDSSLLQGSLTDAQIYAAIAASVAEGVIAWTAIENPQPPQPPSWALQLATSPPALGALLWNDAGRIAITSGAPASYAFAWVLALPITPPALPGILWNDGGFLAISALGSSSGTFAWVAALPITLPAISGILWNDGLFVALS